MTAYAWPVLVALVCSIGCGSEGGPGSTTDAATDPTTSTMMPTTDGGPASTTMTTPGDDDDDDGTPTTRGPGDDTSTASDSSGPPPADSSSDEGNVGMCDPQAQTDPCLMCVVEPCCQFWMQCQADEGCACIIDCHVLGAGSLGSCESQCNSDGELYQAVFFCGQQSCLGTCDWDCC